MANLVARRCELVEIAAHRELIWFLQLRSHQERGLEKLARELLERYPARAITPAMRKFGTEASQLYTAGQIKAIRAEIPRGEEEFPLSGELTSAETIELVNLPDAPARPWDAEDEEAAYTALQQARIFSKAKRRPTGYSAGIFVRFCHRAAAEGLAQFLKQICLNPAIRLDQPGPWYFPDLVPTLNEFMASEGEARRRCVVFTELGKEVCETLEYALQSRCLVVIDGLARMGKTFAAKAWCEMNPGRARYVQVPSTNDDIGFFRAIAKAVGVSINLNSKAQELRQRVEEGLQRGNLGVVFDEAHYLWPNGNYRLALPSRLNWIMTALVNHQVPVCFITTPQFFRSQRAVEQRTHWTSEQFIGRIGHYQKLPDSLDEADLAAVSRFLLPEGNTTAIEILVKYAQGSSKYLAAIETAVRRARYLAGQDGRTQATLNDLKRAIRESVIPSDSALASALSGRLPRPTALAPVTRGQDTLQPGRRRGIAPATEPRYEVTV